MKFLVVICNKCKKSLLAKENHKTRSCPYCGNHIKISNTKVIISTNDVTIAKDILKNYKEKKSRYKNQIISKY